MKSVKKHIESISSTEIKEKFFQSCDEERLECEAFNICEALTLGIPTWSKSKEGSVYWMNVWNKANNGLLTVKAA